MKTWFFLFCQIQSANGAVPTCEPVAAVDGIQRIDFPSKTVYAQFSKHVFGEDKEVMDLLEGKDLKEVQSKIAAYLAQPNIADKVRSLQHDQSNLRGLLQNKKIGWIAIEASPKEVRNGTPIDAQAEDYLATKDAFDGLHLPEGQATSLLTFLYSPEVILKANQPSLFKNIRFVPADDDVAKDKSLMVVQQMAKTKSDLIALGRGHRISLDAFKSLVQLSRANLENLHSMSEEEIERSLGQIGDFEAKSLARELLSEGNAFLKLSHERDITAADTLSSTPGNGYLLMGSAHGPGVLSRLKATCAGGSRLNPNTAR